MPLVSRLVVEGDRSERQDCFTGFLHGVNVLLEPFRGGGCAQLAGVGHDDWRSSAALRGHAIDVANPSGVVHVIATDASADTDNAIGRGNLISSASAQGRVAAAGGVVIKRPITVGRVVVAGGVASKAPITVSRVLAADGVAKERLKTIGRVVAAGGVAVERLNTVGRVEAAGGVVKERA